MTKSLWPDTIGVVKETPPVSILREQAALLGEKTRNLVTAEVDSAARYGSFYDTFYLVAPALDNYMFELFKTSRNIESFYPITFSSDKLDIKQQEIASEDELLKVLANIFSHPKTINIIESMLIQSGWAPNTLEEPALTEDEIPF